MDLVCNEHEKDVERVMQNNRSKPFLPIVFKETITTLIIKEDGTITLRPLHQTQKAD